MPLESLHVNQTNGWLTSFANGIITSYDFETCVKEARHVFFFFFCRGVFILKLKFRREDMLRLLLYVTKLMKCYQSLWVAGFLVTAVPVATPALWPFLNNAFFLKI